MKRSKPAKSLPFEDTNGLAVTIPDEEDDDSDADSIDNEPTDDDLKAHVVV